MLDLKKANEIVRKAKRETEIYRTKLVPYAKKIKLHSKRGTLFEKLYRVIEFEKKKNECLKELYEDKTSGDKISKAQYCQEIKMRWGPYSKKIFYLRTQYKSRM